MSVDKSTLKKVIEKNLTVIESEILEACAKAGRRREEIQLVCVTKTQPIESLEVLLELGYSEFGENRVQELDQKAGALSARYSGKIRWHLIGHLQTNKIRQALKWTSVLHSLDRLALAEKLQSQLLPLNKKLTCFLEVKTSDEATKLGASLSEAAFLVESIQKLSQIELVGVMTMAPFTEDPNLIKSSFAAARELRDQLGLKTPGLRFLSMGMSHDFKIAIALGATHIRVGSRIFQN